METIKIYGRGVLNGVAEGEAMVCHESIQGWAGVDEKTGKIIEKGHSHEGECIDGKILVLPCAKGSNGWGSHFHSAMVAGHVAAGWVFEKLDSRCASAIVELNIPAVVDTEGEPVCDVIKNGDIVRVDGTKGVIEILSRKE